jgi:hypothetical protein
MLCIVCLCVQETFDKPSLDTTQKECDHPKTLEIVNRIVQSIVTALTTIHDSSQEENIKILNSQIDELKFITSIITSILYRQPLSKCADAL